jgi:hypothetical protein
MDAEAKRQRWEEAKRQRWERTLRDAAKILGTDDCREDVEHAMAYLGMTAWISVGRTTKGKADLRRVARALRRLQDTLKSTALPPTHFDFPPSDEQIQRWINKCDEIANKVAAPFGVGAVERRAAEYAYGLMIKYHRPVSLSKKSQFEKLAALLATVLVSGDRNANFHHYCREVVRSAKTTAK